MTVAEELIALYRADRYRAHQGLFRRRHEDETPAFHAGLIADFWNPGKRLIEIGFRGAAKSTIFEEGVAIAAAEGVLLGRPLFNNCVFIGPTEGRASERLGAIVNEFKTNDDLRTLYGDVIGGTETQTKVVLRNGRVIQAIGRDQDMRGMKHLDWRPDWVVVDDFEDKDNVLSPDGRRRSLRWFLRELRLACSGPRTWTRVLCTIMDPDCVPVQLEKAGWPSKVYPIAYFDAAGELQSMWEAKFPKDWLEEEHAQYVRLGEADIWDMEMMCRRDVQVGNRAFRPEMFRLEPVLHTFHAKYAMIDPARTVNRRTSTMTGWAVWSWERNRLIVWEAGAKFLMPDEIIDLAFRISGEHEPIEVGIEEDGLNEWLQQPLRVRQQTDGSIPVRAVRAPRGKIDFIRGLQPFFAAGEVVFVREMPELRDQLLGFPTGRIDAPNALAYALQLRPGRLIYDGWNGVLHTRPLSRGHREGFVYLAANATRSMVSGICVRLVEGRLEILADFVVEGFPAEAAGGVLRPASMFAGRGLTVIAGPPHFDTWHNVGLVQAFRAFGVDVRPGGAIEAGREFIRAELQKNIGLEPAFSVSEGATWTLRGFSGGYSRSVHNGVVADEADNNRYRVLMEGLESLCGLFAFGSMEARNYAYDKGGRPYLSIIPPREQVSV